LLTHKQIETFFSDLSGQASALAELRQATTPYQVNLSADMAAALGMPQRRLTPFLATVVSVIANKLEIDDETLKLRLSGDTKRIQSWLGDNEWSILERELFAAVVRDSKAFILTSWKAEGPKYAIVHAHNGICGAHVVCEEGEPVYGWNTWSKDGTQYLDVYRPHQVEKYIKPAGDKKEWAPRQDEPDEAWPVAWVDSDGQPLGIALTEFSIKTSDIVDALQIGRDMNETLLDMLASSRTQGWPQRWLRGQKNPHVLQNDLGC
jgi:hypothetical protein